jgi:hypothetical protein
MARHPNCLSKLRQKTASLEAADEWRGGACRNHTFGLGAANNSTE